MEIELKDDFGFTLVDSVEATKRKNAETYTNKLERMWNTIEPFLDNLARDPHKDIHWPDRDKKIAEFKKKLREIVDKP